MHYLFIYLFIMVFAGVTIGVKTEAALMPNLNVEQNISNSGTNNLSKLGGFVVLPDSNGLVKLLDSDSSDSTIIYSNAKEIMGYVTTKYEYFRVGDISSGDYEIVVLYKIELEPKENVLYKNGLFSLFDEIGDAYLEYVEFTSDFQYYSNCQVMDTKPESSIITYTNTVTIGISPGIDSSGKISANFSYEESVSSTFNSVLVINKSSLVENFVKIRYDYPYNDSYSGSSNKQFGCFRLRVRSFENMMILKMNTTAQLVIAEKSPWGECRTTTGSIHNKYLNIS